MSLRIFGSPRDYSATFTDDGTHQGFTLKPCPFCGGNNLELSNTHTACYSVECMDCDASVQGPSRGSRQRTKLLCETAHRRAMAGAAERWNRRAPK